MSYSFSTSYNFRQVVPSSVESFDFARLEGYLDRYSTVRILQQNELVVSLQFLEIKHCR